MGDSVVIDSHVKQQPDRALDGTLTAVTAVTAAAADNTTTGVETTAAAGVCVAGRGVDASLGVTTDVCALPDVVNGSTVLLLRCSEPGAVMEAERAASAELESLRQEVRERGHSRPQDEELLNAMREQVASLTEKEQTLEQRLQCVCEENSELRESLSSLHTRLSLQEQQSQQHMQQLAEAWREVEVSRARTQELQSQVEALQEEASIQEGNHSNNTSLLSELELSLDTLGLGPDREQLTQEVESILRLLLPVTRQTEEQGGGQDDLQGMMGLLKSLAQEISQQHTAQVCVLQEENRELRLLSERSRVAEEHLQQAIRDRDEAISKKTLMEAELVRSKSDMMSLNNQLLEAIQRKLELSQELEAWQDDIQVILNQQLRTQCEQSQRKPVAAHPLSFLRRSRRLSTAPTCIAETTTANNNGPSPWRDWLKRGK